MISINCRGIKIPLYKRIINLGLFSYERTSLLIDKLKPEDQEWEKVKILLNDLNYLSFLKEITGKREREIADYLNDFYQDEKFKRIFSEKLKAMEKTKSDWGDIRFHSLSLYAAIRARRPKVMIEAGVASGKSTALILLAMEHNKTGQLISIDLPNKKGNILADGAKTSTGKHEIGWLTPEYLKGRWDLKLGDSIKVLPKIVKGLKVVDVFLHDSLHTYSHVKRELDLVAPKMKKGGIILCDNINLGAGQAFDEFLENKKLIGYAYRDFGGVIL